MTPPTLPDPPDGRLGGVILGVSGGSGRVGGVIGGLNSESYYDFWGSESELFWPSRKSENPKSKDGPGLEKMEKLDDF